MQQYSLLIRVIYSYLSARPYASLHWASGDDSLCCFNERNYDDVGMFS